MMPRRFEESRERKFTGKYNCIEGTAGNKYLDFGDIFRRLLRTSVHVTIQCGYVEWLYRWKRRVACWNKWLLRIGFSQMIVGFPKQDLLLSFKTRIR